MTGELAGVQQIQFAQHRFEAALIQGTNYWGLLWWSLGHSSQRRHGYSRMESMSDHLVKGLLTLESYTKSHSSRSS